MPVGVRRARQRGVDAGRVVKTDVGTRCIRWMKKFRRAVRAGDLP
jgi:hypothetical protein